VETRDILKRRPPEDEVEQRVSSRAGRVFWIRGGIEGGMLGPTSFSGLLWILRSIDRAAAQVSADGHRWMPVARFMRLAMLDRLASDVTAVSSRPSLLPSSAPISLFARITERRSTGRFVVFGGTAAEVAQGNPDGSPVAPIAELHVVRGRPTHVISGLLSHETPEQLVRGRIVEEARINEIFHAVLDEERPLARIVAQRTGMSFDERWDALMAERLEPVICRDTVTYFFNPSRPDRTNAFAPSLLALVPKLIHRTRTVGELKRVLMPVLDREYVRTDRFEPIIEELDLTDTQRATLDRFGRTPKLRDALVLTPGSGEKFVLTMGYLMLALGILAPAHETISTNH
jgi:hypothetical protein